MKKAKQACISVTLKTQQTAKVTVPALEVPSAGLDIYFIVVSLLCSVGELREDLLSP